MPTQKIFFSYSRADGSVFAQRLAVDLKNKGFDAWIDQEDIRAGSAWDIEIEKALHTCDCLLFIETAQSVSSRNVLDEVYYALENHKKVIPIILKDSKTPFRLQRLQHIDFSKNYDAGLSHLVNELEGNDCAGTPQLAAGNQQVNAGKSFYQKYARAILGITALVIMIAAILLFTEDNKEHSKETIIENEMHAPEYTGNWVLEVVEPKAMSQNGYIKIEPVEENKVNIKSYVQFYYFKNNDTSYLEVFNGFTGCSPCTLQKEIKLQVEDIAVASRTIKVAGADHTAGAKPGDTIMNASSNKSISASARLHFIDNQTAEINVQHTTTTGLAHGQVLQPFVYTFRFRKRE